MMVESSDGSKALLGRPKKLRGGVLTCLSGFIEQVREHVLWKTGRYTSVTMCM